MMGLVLHKFPYAPTYAVMADAGFEHIAPVTAANWARTRCAEFGLDLTVVRNPKRTYLEMVEQRRMFPSAQLRQCTSDLKRGPIDKFIRSLPHRIIVNCIGIRAEESNARSRLSPLSINHSLTTRQRTVYNWFPIYEARLSDVLAWHWVNAIRLPSGVRAGVPQRWNNRRISQTSVLPGLHLFDRCRSPSDPSSRRGRVRSDLEPRTQVELHHASRCQPGAYCRGSFLSTHR
jgi:3'-phosphoadenosine 5'-phosphosulfate sulfotransferase (PAPS reductase)/FAD synthetase